MSQFIDALLFLFVSFGKYASIAAAVVVLIFALKQHTLISDTCDLMQVVRVRHHTMRTVRAQ